VGCGRGGGGGGGEGWGVSVRRFLFARVLLPSRWGGGGALLEYRTHLLIDALALQELEQREDQVPVEVLAQRAGELVLRHGCLARRACAFLFGCALSVLRPPPARRADLRARARALALRGRGGEGGRRRAPQARRRGWVALFAAREKGGGWRTRELVFAADRPTIAVPVVCVCECVRVCLCTTRLRVCGEGVCVCVCVLTDGEK
jgi:hypothetical protein